MILCLYYIYYTKVYIKAAIYVHELILTLFGPVDIKCKKPNAKNLWKRIFRASRKVSFSYFPTVALNHGGCPWYLLEFSRIILQYSVWDMQHLRWSSLWRKISICWKLLLTVATASFILNVTGLLDLIMKHIDKFRLRQINIPCGIYMFKIVKKHQNNVSNQNEASCFYY